MSKAINATELKFRVELCGHESHFFTRRTMRFFGDTMRNYGVRSATIRTNYNDAGEFVEGGLDIEVWELFRRRPVKHGLQSSAFFRKGNYKRAFPIEG